MTIKYNGNNIASMNYNGNSIKNAYYNGSLVWQKSGGTSATALNIKNVADSSIITANTNAYNTNSAGNIYYNNDTAPVIAGYDFAACENYSTLPTAEKFTLYYVANTVSDRTATNFIYANPSVVTSDIVVNTFNATSISFNENTNIVSLKSFNTSKITSMLNMFYDCSKLISLPIMDTSKVTTMRLAFYYCIKLQEIPFLNTSNVLNMSYAFSNCKLITTIPQLDTSKVTTMENMFSGCLKMINIPFLNTSKVTSMSNMFSGCLVITTIPRLDTSKVTSMSSMFYYCQALTGISWAIDLTSVLHINCLATMFTGCNNLTGEIHFKNVQTGIVSSLTNAAIGLTTNATIVIDNTI